MTRMRRAVTWVVIVFFVVLGLAAFVRLVEPRLAFYPFPGEQVATDTLGAPIEAHTVTTADGERLRVWRLRRESPRAQVTYFHGNGGNLSVWSDVLVGLWQRGLDVVALDYRGYGVSTGRPSESGLYRDVDATLDAVHKGLRVANVPLVYWGRSLGATFAAYAAGRRQPDGVVLEAAFPSARAVLESSPLFWALSWFGSYRFPTAHWMRSVQCPVLVLHGDRDSVIPYRLGQRLFETLEEPKRFVTIAGGDHNDPLPPSGSTYWTALDEFLASLASR
jgi:uncharacterized protein